MFKRYLGKKDVLESWPTSPVLHYEEANAREKEKAHRFYERQLKASSWYLQPPQRAWIEVVESDDDDDTCSQCYYDDACGCMLVSSHGNINAARRKSGRSSLGDALSIESGPRASAVSKNSTEDEKSFYDNLCQFCKITTLERRARKYGEWRRRFSVKLAEARARDDGDEPRVCTCAMDSLSFIEWKKIYDQKELTRLSKVENLNENSQTELHSNSDYGTQKSEMHSDYDIQKSKDSTSTVVYRDFPSLTVKSTSLGYNSLSSIPYTEGGTHSESDYTSTDLSETEEFENECTDSDLHAGKTCTNLTLRVTREVSRDGDDEVFRRGNSLTRRSESKRYRKRRYRNSNSLKTKAHLHKERPTKLQREVVQMNGNTDKYELRSEGETTQTCSDDKDSTKDDKNLGKIPMENDENLPPDLLSEFLTIARTIDAFYENAHMKKFLENRILAKSRERINGTSSNGAHVDVKSTDVTTSNSGLGMTSRGSVVDQAGTENFSGELRKRIRSLERLCSFFENSDEESELDEILEEELKALGSTPKEETPVWRLSQQSINLTLSRRSRSRTSSDSAGGRSRLTSTSGSGSGNSRCSTGQGNHNNQKPSITSIENLKSPDSGFSDSMAGLSSADSCQLGTKWVGSMQWDYSDWQFYYGVPGHDQKIATSKERLLTIDKTRPQDPLDWDW